MNKRIVAWLLEGSDPAVRYRTMTELLDESPTAASAAKAREAAIGSPELDQVFDRAWARRGSAVH